MGVLYRLRVKIAQEGARYACKSHVHQAGVTSAAAQTGTQPEATTGFQRLGDDLTPTKYNMSLLDQAILAGQLFFFDTCVDFLVPFTIYVKSGTL